MATERGAEREASFILFCTFACASCVLEDVTLVLSDGAPTAEKAAATPVRADSSAAPECREGGDPPFSPLCVAKTRRRPLWCRWWQHITFFCAGQCRPVAAAHGGLLSRRGLPSSSPPRSSYRHHPSRCQQTRALPCPPPLERVSLRVAEPQKRVTFPPCTQRRTHAALPPFFFSFLLFSLSLILSSQFLACMCQRLRKRYLCVPGEHT